MDPHLRREIDAFLEDLYEGTDLEVALAKAGLVIRLQGDPDDDINDQIAHALDFVEGTIMEMARADAVKVKTSWDGEPFLAIGIDTLAMIVDEARGDDE